MSHHTMKTLYETENIVEIRSFKILAGIRFPNYKCIIASHQVGDHLQAGTFARVRKKKDDEAYSLHKL